MDHPSRSKKDKQISKILTVLVVLFISFIIFIHIQLQPTKTKIKMVTSQNETFIVYETCDTWRCDCYYKLYEKAPGKILDKKIPVIKNEPYSSHGKLTKDDFFYSFTKYRYNNKEVRVYSGKDNSCYIFKIEGSSNYIYCTERDILYSYLHNDYSEYQYLVPIYMSRLKNPKENTIYYISAVLLALDTTESFPIITKNINNIQYKEIRDSILKYINDYPNSKKTKHDLISKMFYL
ncbi:hypothetical protein Z969_05850 [Clostridium novyi A str. 4570]|uniref:Uncharacterized protein n=1 Tax=Clostridium novyi A str. 4570 TaxID=1444290 RepID=A0AA88ZPH0_CLONO|nr:hypothetical protein [Clostridium novyi]KGN02291.1 hypothetical protein Z969_05850 [Clostridium novyi A str. 4570]